MPPAFTDDEQSSTVPPYIICMQQKLLLYLDMMLVIFDLETQENMHQHDTKETQLNVYFILVNATKFSSKPLPTQTGKQQ